MSPKVSVLLPTYNCAHFIEEAIKSVLSQSFTDYELIIVDDGSKDNTKNIINSFLNDIRVNYYYKENSGLGDTLNYAIEKSKGKYLIRMDSDDICLPNRFEKLVSFMDENPSYVACGSNVAYFIKNPNIEQIYYRNFPTNSTKIIEGLLRLSHVLCHPSLIIKAEAAKLCGGYQIKGVGEDWDFFLQISKIGKIGNYAECLYLMRMNPNSITHTKWEECFINNKFAIERYRNGLEIDSLEEFKKNFKKGFLTKTILNLDSLSLNIYRNGLESFILHNKLKYYFNILLASFVSPSRLINRLKSIFSNTK